jgi:hypothetical protein
VQLRRLSRDCCRARVKDAVGWHWCRRVRVTPGRRLLAGTGLNSIDVAWQHRCDIGVVGSRCGQVPGPSGRARRRSGPTSVSPRSIGLVGYRPVVWAVAAVPGSAGLWWVWHYQDSSPGNAAPTTIAGHGGGKKWCVCSVCRYPKGLRVRSESHPGPAARRELMLPWLNGSDTSCAHWSRCNPSKMT